MVEQLEMSGFWWLPDNPENKMAGSFRRSSNGEITLELFGLELFDFHDVPDTDQPTILGISDSGKKVTAQNLPVDTHKIQ